MADTFVAHCAHCDAPVRCPAMLRMNVDGEWFFVVDTKPLTDHEAGCTEH